MKDKIEKLIQSGNLDDFMIGLELLSKYTYEEVKTILFGDPRGSNHKVEYTYIKLSGYFELSPYLYVHIYHNIMYFYEEKRTHIDYIKL